MSASTSRRIIVMVAASGTYGRESVRGVVDYAREHCHWDILFEGVTCNPLVMERVRLILREGGADGMIAQIHSPKVLRAIVREGLPAVDLSGSLRHTIPLVRCNWFSVGQLAARHLMETGFRNFAFYGKPKVSEVKRELIEGYRQELHRKFFDCQVVLAYDDQRALPSDQAGWLKTLPRPAAVLAEGDVIARHCIRSCQDLGLRVPEDVAVMGYGNEELECSLCIPPITSVVLPSRQVGQQAAAVLDSLFRGQEPPARPLTLPARIVVSRQSTNILSVADGQVSAAMGYIRDHACEGIRASDVAARVSMSPRTLECRFVAILGRTPLAEIRRVQVECAKTLLAESDRKIVAIADSVGIRHLRSFQRVFHQHTGMSSHEYRVLSRP